MARIIRKEHHLEEKYYAIKQERVVKSAEDIRKFGKVALLFSMIYIASVTVSVVADVFLTAFFPLTICLGACLLIAVFVCLNDDISKHVDTDILISGIDGERIATNLLITLPNSYTVFQNVMLTYENKKSEIDNIVVGKSGVFVIEVKNHNSHIVGDVKDIYWTQYKVGRGGTPYTNEVYNPVKQVGTHIYCLANYLRQNGINTYIKGMVYFTNVDCLLSLTGNSNISVYANSAGDEERLCREILSGNHMLDAGSVRWICGLIEQL